MINLQSFVNTEVAKLDAKIASLTTQLATKTTALTTCQASMAALQAAFDAYKLSHPDPVPPPPSTGRPDTTNTGAKGTLTAYTGSLTINADNVTIQNKTINGSMRWLGANGSLINCRVTYSGNYGVDAEGAGPITITDCTFVGPGASGPSNAAILGQGTFLRNDISKSENGILHGGGKSITKANYIHDLDSSLGPNAGHYDGITCQGGQDDVLIEGNRIVGRDTSDVFIKNDSPGESINNIRVNANWFEGNPGYLGYSDNRGPGGPITNISYTNNICTKPGYGNPNRTGWFSFYTAVTFSGNIEAGTNLPVTS